MLRRNIIVVAVALLALPVLAHANPQFKKPYYMSQEPTITGTVESVTEHSFTVATEGGEHMTFEVDSHTLMPATLTPETRVWLEYALLDNGDHRAIRVSPIGEGSLAQDQFRGERPRAEGDMDENNGTYGASVDNNTAMGSDHSMDNDANGPTAYNSDADDKDRAEDAAEEAHENAEDQNQATTTTTDENKELPRTASPWPLVEAVGALAMVSGAGLWFIRRRRTA